MNACFALGRPMGPSPNSRPLLNQPWRLTVICLCLDADCELSVLPVSVNLSDHELSVCPGSNYEYIFELSVWGQPWPNG